MGMKSSPSVAVVQETCVAACKAMKLQSKQLLLLSASYAKLPFDNAGNEILNVLGVTMKAIQQIQESLTIAGEAMNQDLEEDFNQDFPQTLVVTEKEYAFLNAVFQEYTSSILSEDSSKDFSLFCSTSDICTGARPCQDNAEKSNVPFNNSQSLLPPNK